MKKRILPFISISLAAICLLALFAPGAAALTYNGSSSYKSGPYYKKLCDVELTGDLRTDIVNVARSQIGYFEGDSSTQLSGTVFGDKNYTEYGRWYGMQDMWCAIFVSWCAYVAKIDTTLIPKHAFTPDGLKWFQNKGQAYSRADVAAGKYTPEPGDLIYFKSPRNNNPTNHIGIVTKYSNRVITSIEGNTSSEEMQTNGNTVSEKTHPIDDTYIVYICRPGYETGPSCADIMVQLDEKGAVSGGVKVRGWCFDKRDTSVALKIHVYIGGPKGSADAEAHTDVVADKSRPDVNNVHKCGNNHGYDATVKTNRSGKQQVYVYAVNPNTSDIAFIASFTADIPAQTANKKGDINKDGYINNKDIVALFRYVSGTNREKDESAYDYNGDGEVNNKDVTALFRYVSSFPG